MTSRNITHMTVLLALLVVPPSVSAGPPFRTDDPEAVEKGHAEFYVFGTTTRTADGINGILPGFEFNYGIVENVQLHLVTPFSYSSPSGGAHEHGYGDTEIGVKWQLNEESESLPMVGIFPLVEIPSGNADKGLGAGKSQIFIPVWLQKSWDELTTYGGGGYWVNNAADGKNYWFVGWAGQYKLSDHVTLGGELFHNTSPSEGEKSSTGFNLGGYYNFDEHNHLLFSAGRGLTNASETNRFSAYLGYQYTL